MLVSLDVKSLFLSIPVKEALCYFEEDLPKKKEGSTEWGRVVRQYIKLVPPISPSDGVGQLRHNEQPPLSPYLGKYL